MDQRSQEWFEARRGLATGSRFADVLARTKSGTESASRKNYKAQLVAERLTGKIEESYTNAAMQWGTDYEPVARLEFQLLTGLQVEEAPFVKHKTLQAGASPDGFVGEDELIEIKCPNTATHIETVLAEKLPSKYEPQVQGQMWITGKKGSYFVSYDPRMPKELQLVWVYVERDNDYIKILEAEVVAFLSEVEKLETKLKGKILNYQ